MNSDVSFSSLTVGTGDHGCIYQAKPGFLGSYSEQKIVNQHCMCDTDEN